MAYKIGIDVSKHNGTIDWNKVKASGIKFAMIRAGYGSSHIDEQFKRNVTECNRLKIPCGCYWFSYALNTDQARQEAQVFLKIIKQYKIYMPVCYDLEYDSFNYAKKKGVTITKSKASAFAKAFLSEVEKSGYYAMNYTNVDCYRNYFDSTVNSKYDLWLASWPKNVDFDKPPMKCSIWQYTDKGKVNGIKTAVDKNVAYKDFPAIIKKAGLNNL